MLKRKHYTQVEQQAYLAAHRESGLTKKAFCQQENISYSAFKNWHKRISNKSEPVAFCELKPTLDVQAEANPASHHKLYYYFPDGGCLVFPSNMSPTQLKQMLSSLRGQ